ncbi:hypothetical protein DC74_136 [Streptomyces noursei]|nr:hypothetical protein DC74_136 [Streptomyces noursei]
MTNALQGHARSSNNWTRHLLGSTSRVEWERTSCQPAPQTLACCNTPYGTRYSTRYSTSYDTPYGTLYAFMGRGSAPVLTWCGEHGESVLGCLTTLRVFPYPVLMVMVVGWVVVRAVGSGHARRVAQHDERRPPHIEIGRRARWWDRLRRGSWWTAPWPSHWDGATANGLRVDIPDTGAGPLGAGRPPPFHPRDTEVRGQRCPPGSHPDCLGHARLAKPKPPSGARTWSTPPAPGSPSSRSRWSCCTPTTQTAAARLPWAFCPSAARCARPCDPRSYPGKPPPHAYWRRPHTPGVRYFSTSGTRSGNARSLN